MFPTNGRTNETHAATTRYTSHEVTAPRAVGPSGRTWLIKSCDPLHPWPILTRSRRTGYQRHDGHGVLGMAQHQPIRKTTRAPGSDIPDKLYFRIGEVARLCDVPAYVLRFWESEFPQLKPHKGGTGQRLYRRRDVEMALRIKSLLYHEGYTIPGARQVFKGELKQKEPQLALSIEPSQPTADPRQLRKLQKDLRDLHALLSKPAARTAVHPIRAPRAAATPRRSTEKLFDLPLLPEDDTI
jgi:DNA-binding transcriptional MerR regulator